MAEALAVHGGAAIEEGAEQHGDLRRRLLAEASQDIHADDERDAGDAEQRARQLQWRERLMARHQQRDEEHEDRGGGVQHAGEPAVDVELAPGQQRPGRSEEHTSELQSLMRISYAVFCLKKKKNTQNENEQTLTRNK